MSVAKPLMRYHGSKWKIAPWVISHFPEHNTYVEPFGGSASVLLRKPISNNEVYNDINNEVVALFRVLRDSKAAAELEKMVALTPYSRVEFEMAQLPADSDIEIARRLLVRANMAFGSGGATYQVGGFRTYTNRPGKSLAAHWRETGEKIMIVANRLSGVIIENKDAVSLINEHARKDTLFYLDPPYLHNTRNAAPEAYKDEMSDDQHIALLSSIKRLAKANKGMFVLSGYASELYDDILINDGWRKQSRQVSASGRKGGVIRTECLWLSPNCMPGQMDLFSA